MILRGLGREALHQTEQSMFTNLGTKHMLIWHVEKYDETLDTGT